MSEKFTVIHGDDSKSDNKEKKLEQLYMKAFGKELAEISAYSNWNQCRDNLKRAVFYAVKYYGLERIDRRHSSEPRTYEQVNNDFALLECVKMLMRQLTPREMMSMFPIEKEYDGEEYGCKDYFFTVEKLKEYNLDVPLGAEALEELLWDYQNNDLFAFSAVAFSIISNIYKAQTGKGIMEQWCENQGIGTYTIDQEKGIIRNNQTGEIGKMEKRSHIQIVK